MPEARLTPPVFWWRSPAGSATRRRPAGRPRPPFVVIAALQAGASGD